MAACVESPTMRNIVQHGPFKRLVLRLFLAVIPLSVRAHTLTHSNRITIKMVAWAAAPTMRNIVQYGPFKTLVLRLCLTVIPLSTHMHPHANFIIKFFK